MSTSFWFQGVPCVACFVVCPHFVFKFGFACRVAGVWVRIRLRQCVRCVFTVFLALSHVGCCVAVGVQGCSTLLHIALRECFPCEWFLFSFQHLGQSRVERLFFLCLTVAARRRTNHFCRTLWNVECLTGRAEFTSVCCGDAHWCMLYFRDCAFLLLVRVSIIFLFVRTSHQKKQKKKGDRNDATEQKPASPAPRPTRERRCTPRARGEE